MKTKEGGVMDIHKEREAFESWIKKEYPEMLELINHGDVKQAYDFSWEVWQAAKAQAVLDLGELQERIAGHQYYHDERGHMAVDMDDVVKEISGFDSWKAQAVPEGFVFMPRICTNKMAHAAKAIDGRLSAFKYADVYKAMIEAQEKAND